jgi:hypothetical protein
MNPPDVDPKRSGVAATNGIWREPAVYLFSRNGGEQRWHGEPGAVFYRGISSLPAPAAG